MEDEVDDLIACIDKARQVTFKTFRSTLDKRAFQSLCEMLGYETDPGQGLTMKRDYAVGYYVSEFRGEKCYYVKWSAIEYIFVSHEAYKRLMAH